MAENINGQSLLASGGHVWQWQQFETTVKTVGSVAILGEYGMVTSIKGRPGRIVARNGGPALLTGSGASSSAADAALTAIENAIELLIAYGAEVSWEDDQGHSGTALFLMGYDRVGPRSYGISGGAWQAWQGYYLRFRELNGGW